MSLSNKYHIPQAAVDAMVNDGVIGCNWPRYESIYQAFKKAMSVPGAVKTHVVLDIADKERMSERQIREIISRF